MPITHLTYIFDPLCGWCYGAAPALEKLARLEGVSISLAPSGLFSGDGARPIDGNFAAFAWQHDKRIAQMTGQIFSQAYRDTVLGASGASLDSSAATLGIVATGMTDGPDQEPTALKALQEARYVDGRDNSRLESVTAILADAGFDAAAALLVKVDRELLATCNARISAARSDMTRFGIQGVPALIAERDGRRTLMPSGVLFGDFEALNEFLTGA